ncbi:MAG TPA: NADPH-dependent FMN reductase [Alphaproteobacteria bacterium]
MSFSVAVIVGSLRKESLNLRLAKALVKLGTGKFNANILRIDDLPLFNEELEPNFPASATRLKSEIENADAVLIVTPEYNRSVPAPLKNAIDWASRPYGKNSFAKKPTAISGTSQGAISTAAAQQHLKPVLNYLDVRLMGQPEAYIRFSEGMIDQDGNVTNPDSQKFLQKYVDSFVTFVQEQPQRANAKAA